ncbi:hypothetical protein HK098_003065 [Nowakowskiella sp. JEL0407]|nr:hypothetical protein HK098_003065 [Nowakowskiella sp. JEL0407]
MAYETYSGMDIHDDPTELLLAELQEISEKNEELHRQIAEMRKDRILWKDSLQKAAENDSKIQQLNVELETLQGEVLRLRRSNEDLQKRLQQEFEDNESVRVQWQEQEKSLRKALIEERMKHKDLRERLAYFENDKTDEVVDESKAIRETEAKSLKDEVSKLKKTIQELNSMIELRDGKIKSQDDELRKQDREITELQLMMNRIMDDIESTQKDAIFSDSSDDDEAYISPPLSPAGYLTTPMWAGHKRSKSAATVHTQDTLHLTIPLRRTRSNSASQSEGPTSSNSLLEEFNKLNIVEETQIESKFAEIGPNGEGLLRKKLSAIGLSTDGNRKALKKRLHAFIKRKERVIMKETTTAEQKLEAMKALNAARA